METLFTRKHLARALGLSKARIEQLVRRIEPVARTPHGLKLYSLATLEALRERRRRWEERQRIDRQRGDDRAGGPENERPDSWAGRSGRAQLTKPRSTVEEHRARQDTT